MIGHRIFQTTLSFMTRYHPVGKKVEQNRNKSFGLITNNIKLRLSKCCVFPQLIKRVKDTENLKIRRHFERTKDIS